MARPDCQGPSSNPLIAVQPVHLARLTWKDRDTGVHCQDAEITAVDEDGRCAWGWACREAPVIPVPAPDLRPILGLMGDEDPITTGVEDHAVWRPGQSVSRLHLAPALIVPQPRIQRKGSRVVDPPV